MCRVRASK